MAFDYRVRLALRSDLHLLPAIERAAVRLFESVGLFEPYSRLFVTAEQFEVRQYEGRLLVAVDSRDAPTGFATWACWGKSVHLEEMDVHPEHGQRGVGKRLLEAVCQRAAKAGADEITLSTTRGVPWNEPFYRRCGFHEVAETAYTPKLVRLRAAEEAAGLPVDRRVIMRRSLAPWRGRGRS